ncbi:MAG: cation transporter [Clostridia bacterium]|nr:cation transporter [Clostridia bacterium]
MTKWLVRRFVADADNVKQPSVRYAYGQLAGITGLVCNLVLFGIKLLAGILSGSLAVIADAFNNLSDAGSVIVTLVGFKLSNAPADRDHPFGHGRMEYLSTMGVAVLIILAGFEVAVSSVEKIFNPTPSDHSAISLVILVAAILIKLWMAVFNRYIGKTIDSDAIIAAGIDSRNDVICTTLVLVSALVSRFTSWELDGYIGLLVALFVVWSGFSVIRQTVSPLLGQAPDEQLVKDIEETVLSFDGVVGIHDMMVHDYGPGRVIASLHAEVPADRDMIESHDIIDLVERELMRKFNVITCIHMDPIDTNDPETLRLKELAVGELTAIDERLSLHDFRVVFGPSHTNLIFDVVVPFDYPDKSQLPSRIEKRLQAIDERLFTVIQVETKYT